MKEQGVPTLFDIMKKNPEMTYNEAVKVQEDIKLRNEESAAAIKEAGACITAGMKRHKDAMEKMKKDREVKRVPLTESRQKQEELEPIEYDYHKYWKDMYEKEHKLRQEAQLRLAEALEISEAHQKQMGKLQLRLTEVEEDNIKLAHQVEDLKLNGVRKAGL